MPHGARTSLAALILLLGAGGASAEPAQGTTWKDPPAHKPAAEKAPAADRTVAAPAQTASTPAAASQTTRPASAHRKAVAARRAPVRQAARKAAPPAKRVAATAHRSRIAAATTRTARSPHFVAVAPPPPPADGYPRYRSYGYGPGYGFTPGYTDERLDRLSSAEAAGYLVVRGRTVQYPDGRTLRVYRPGDEGEPF
ncbi:hypothetical protein ACRAWG_23695 [Methylobacterium sp. P31]